MTIVTKLYPRVFLHYLDIYKKNIGNVGRGTYFYNLMVQKAKNQSRHGKVLFQLFYSTTQEGTVYYIYQYLRLRY